METYLIRHCQADPDWGAVPRLAIDRPFRNTRTDVRAWGQLCWSDEALHIRLEAEEREIRALEPPVLGMPCNDSCLEFFFCPMPGDLRYFNMEYNPNCSLYLGFGSGVKDLKRLLPNGGQGDELFQPTAERSPTGWRVTYRVPFRFVRGFFPDFAPKSGAAIRANCYKCGDKTSAPHYLTWNPVEGGVTFHSPEQFGKMIFE